jgi:hypothetical protein
MTDQGKLEILGLKKWNAQTLVDSMKTLAGAKPLHACASQMEYDFGFAEVSVTTYIDDIYGTLPYTVVCIIEDNSDGKIKYLCKPEESFNTLQAYSEIVQIIKDDFQIYYIAFQTYGLVKGGKRDEARSRISSYKNMTDKIETFWALLESKNKVSDMNLAFWVLHNDANTINRAIAMAILTNFTEYDAIWWEIMDLQRTKADTLRNCSWMALQLLKSETRKIDWEPAVITIKHLLNGANLFHFERYIELLKNTKISPQLTERVLSGSSDILNLYLNTKSDMSRKATIKFIKQISGDENLKTAEECKKWLKQFENES